MTLRSLIGGGLRLRSHGYVLSCKSETVVRRGHMTTSTAQAIQSITSRFQMILQAAHVRADRRVGDVWHRAPAASLVHTSAPAQHAAMSGDTSRTAQQSQNIVHIRLICSAPDGSVVLPTVRSVTPAGENHGPKRLR